MTVKRGQFEAIQVVANRFVLDYSFSITSSLAISRCPLHNRKRVESKFAVPLLRIKVRRSFHDSEGVWLREQVYLTWGAGVVKCEESVRYWRAG